MLIVALTGVVRKMFISPSYSEKRTPFIVFTVAACACNDLSEALALAI